MRIGLPREVKDGEFRVALTPLEVGALVGAGHSVVLEPGAGAGIGIADAAYTASGATLGAAWDCELVVKVKELQEPEYRKPRPLQTIFCFQHFGPEPDLLDAALVSRATFVAFETVGQSDGSLPILAPMSAIAGRLAVQMGAWCLTLQNGGSGVLLPGLDGIAAGRVAILGGGNVGGNALHVAHGIGAQVTVFLRSDKRLATLRAKYPGADIRVGTETLPHAVAEVDLLIGGVLIPGRMSPKLVTRAMLRSMRPGSALVDVGIDQGGIAETSRATSHSAPTYIEERVVHYCVPNMPAACAFTASQALARAALPFLLELAAGQVSPALATGIQVRAG
ncbi:MAG: alanine dehydrogenase, partial [Betaproteobacteria bacterium]|nr:alanine dehydrogenase [Betaproteobacteria bacterium]